MGKETWDTLDEKMFLNRLGLHKIYGGPTKSYIESGKYIAKRIQCLRGYLSSARRREDWGRMDSIACMIHAEYCMRKELKKLGDEK